MHFCSFPRTEPPAPFVSQVMDVFREHQSDIGTLSLSKGLSSDAVMAILREKLQALGFSIEANKLRRRRSSIASIRDRWLPSRMAVRH
jgi:hypothetical protein